MVGPNELLLGSVAISEMGQLIECLRNGSPFTAVVLSIAGGSVEVRIQFGAP